MRAAAPPGADAHAKRPELITAGPRDRVTRARRPIRRRLFSGPREEGEERDPEEPDKGGRNGRAERSGLGGDRSRLGRGAETGAVGVIGGFGFMVGSEAGVVDRRGVVGLD